MSEQVVQLNEEVIKGQRKELVRVTVEEACSGEQKSFQRKG